MELRGFSEDGKPVKTSVFDLAEGLRQGGETVKMGRSPTHFVYSSMRTGESREVDLQEVAQASGIGGVQFHFDPKAAAERGMMVERDIDQGIAYNLERIKRDEDRAKYLADKGFKNVFNSGDDFYELLDNGKFAPINNKDGFDLSDLTRLGAHAGRDLGAGVATTAAVGGSGVTGGATLAAAGAAGAAGATVGEAAHRMVDKAVGAEADRYNRELSTEDELAEGGKTALIGAAAGVAQPVLNSGGALLKENVAAPLARRFLGEWGATQAAKAEASAAAARLPQGYMSKFATAEEAAAMDAITAGKQALKDGVLDAEGLRKVTGEAKEIARGSAKAPMNPDDEVQAGLRTQFESRTLEQARVLHAQKQAGAEAEAAAAKAEAQRVEVWKEKATEQFAAHKKDLETIFDEKSDMQGAVAARDRIVQKTLDDVTKGTGIKIERDAAGKAAGLDTSSLQTFVAKETDTVFSRATSHLGDVRDAPGFVARVPSDRVKGATTEAIRGEIGEIGKIHPELREAVRGFVDAVANHGAPNADANAVDDAIREIHRNALKAMDFPDVPARRLQALGNVLRAVEKYDVAAAGQKGADNVSHYHSVFNQLAFLKQTGARGVKTPEAMSGQVRLLRELSIQTGGDTTERLRNVLHLDSVLQGAESPFGDLVSPAGRDHIGALAFIRDYPVSGREVIPTDTTKQARKAGAAIVGGIVAKASGGSFIEGAMTGYATGELMPGRFQAVAAGVKKVGGALSNAASGAAKSGAEAAATAGSSSAGRVARTAATQEVLESEARKLKRKK